LDELLTALRLPNIGALFDAIGRGRLPGATPGEREQNRQLAASILLDALLADGVPLPVAAPTPETLIRAAEEVVLNYG
jgi:hypothetical protein